MDPGTQWTFPESYFPRYTFYRNRLADFLPRFYGVVENGHLGTCVANGIQRVDEIKEYFRCFGDRVRISVFDTTARFDAKDLIMQYVAADSSVELKEPQNWLDFSRATDGAPFYNCHLGVCVIYSEVQLHETHTFIANLPIEQRRNIVVYDLPNKQCYVSGMDSSTPSSDLVPYPHHEDGSVVSLSYVLQHILEMKIIAFLETIISFTHRFVPKSRGHPSSDSLTKVGSKLKSFLRKDEIVNDFFDNSAKEADGAEKQYSLYPKRLLEFIGHLVSVTLSQLFSKKFGIMSSLTHEYLYDGHDLGNKIESLLNGFKMPERDNKEGRTDYCQRIGGQILTLDELGELINRSESYIETKVNSLDQMKKLEFELHGLLKMSEVQKNDLIIDIPAIPELSKTLQYSILGIDGVKACGHTFGKLVIYLSDEANKDTLHKADEAIKKTLKKHYYRFGYSTVITEKVTQQHGFIGHGERIKGRIDMDEEMYGSLACFVKLRGINEAEGSESIHGITCGHCVSTSHPEVHHYVKHRERHELLGHVAHRMCENYFLDIASFNVVDHKIPSCEFNMKKSCGLLSAPLWSICGHEPLVPRTTVYMQGAESELMTGIIISSDVITDDVNQLHVPSDYDPMCTVLITPPGRVFRGGEPFSKGGDSGSAICMEDPNNSQNVVVVALLCGAWSVPRVTNSGIIQKEYLCSFASHMRNLLDKFQQEKNCTVMPALS